MANRFNQTNVGGVVTTSGGAMPANNFTNQHQPISRVTPNTKASPVVTSNSHAVEIAGDGGVYDTVSGAAVLREKTNLDAANL